MNQTLWAARHWGAIATQEEDMALWEAQVLGPNHNIDSNLACGRLYRQAGKALYLEFWTGESHCPCCLSTVCRKKKAKTP